MGGLRLMVMGSNENRVLCLLQANRETDCDEMATVRRSLAAIQRAPELRRRAGRRARQGLLPDRHGPLQGPARDQPGPDGRRAGGRDLRAVRLLGLEPADVRPGAGRPPARRAASDGRALVAAAEQVRQPAHRRAVRQRPGRRAHQRRQPGQRRIVLERPDVHRPAARQHDLHARAAVGGRGGAAARHRGPARRPRARLSAGAALQHARPDRRSASTSSSA